MNSENFSFNFIRLKEARTREDVEIVNESFTFFKRNWEREFKSFDCQAPCWEDVFYKHDYVGLVKYGSRPVAFHLYGLQNVLINSCRDTLYMQSNFTPDFCDYLIKREIPLALSLNWMTVDTLFAKNQKSFSFSAVLLGLASKICDNIGFDVMVGAVRNDIGLAKKIIALGGVSAGQRDVYGVPTDMICLMSSMVENLRDNDRNLVNDLWANGKNSRKNSRKNRERKAGKRAA